jgi:Mechanosensitive ion channel, beta-domain
MNATQKIAAVVLVVAAGAAGYGIFRFGRLTASNPAGNPQKKTAQAAPLVDQSPLQAAQQLAQLADTPDEQAEAKDALTAADREVDAAFAQALWQAKYYPPPLSADAKEIQKRLQLGQTSLQTDQQRVKNLTAADAKATGARKDALDDELALVESQVELDQDEVNDAQQDLFRAGGDPHARIQQMQQERQATRSVSVGTAVPAAEGRGLINRFQQWSTLRTKKLLLTKAKSDALAAAAVLSEQHDDLEAETDAEKYNSPLLASHSSLAQSAGASTTGQSGAPSATAASAALSPQDAAALLAQTKLIAAKQLNLASFDKRIDAQKDLADTYTQWLALVEARQNSILRRILIGALIIVLIALIALFFNTWLDSVLEKLHLDRRQIQTLRAIGRVSLQVVAVLFILLIIFGPPSQLGTILGLAGAGLTVALKDFIVSFIGWFVLMGKNGIRLGDWVEINGVTGEVVEIGLFRTVLLETGNWTDSGHPTGRRVTFTNSFATAGHYFNFSTSGQWLWDEIQLILPAGDDPYPLIDAIQKTVENATKPTAALAQEEWKRSVRSREMGTISVEPALSLKPVPGGIEVSVRYITRANERNTLRAQIYQEIVNILGKKPVAPPTAA